MKQYNKSIKGKLFNYFKQRLNIKPSTKGYWRCNCVLCGGKYTMGIHMDYSYAHCFKCEEKLDTMQVLMAVEGLEQKSEAYKYLSIQQEYEYFENHSREAKVYKKVVLPEEYKLITSGDSYTAKAARHYLTKRGFDVNKLAIRGIGYCDSGYYGGYIIFPYYIKGELVYYQGRIFMGDGPKMKNPVDTEFGVGKSQIVYNLDAFYIYTRAFLVESITNALTLGDAAGGINGKSISEKQLSSIINSPCEKVVIILDPDAIENAVMLGLRMVNYKKTKVVQLPEGVDVNDIGRNKTIKFVKNTHWQSYMDIYRLKLNGYGKSTVDTYYRRGPNYVDKRGV